MTIVTYFAREPYLTWHKNGFVRPIMQTPKKRDGAFLMSRLFTSHESEKSFRGRSPSCYCPARAAVSAGPWLPPSAAAGESKNPAGSRSTDRSKTLGCWRN